MKLFYKGLMLTVILAIAAPFLLKDEDGRPLMSWDRVKLPDINLSKKGGEVTAYKWQDANGVWHYADKLNANVESQMITLDPDANLVHFNQPDKKQSAPHKTAGPKPVNTNSATTPVSPLSNAASLISEAKGVNQLTQERFTRQDQLIAEQSR